MTTAPDWLKLEIAIETIGDMIAFYNRQLCQDIMSKVKDNELIRDLTNKVDQLGRERQQCYVKNRHLHKRTNYFYREVAR